MRALTGVVLVGLLVGLLLTTGHPVPIGVVESSSMAPTLEPGDVFLAMPPGVVGGVDAGDIAVFPNDDGWTIHRVVAVEDGAIATAGDANTVVDQHAGDPTVSTAAVAGIVPTVGGQPLAVGLPHSDHRLVAAAVGGLLGLLFAGVLDTHRPCLRPAAVGTIAGVLTVLVWVVGRRVDEVSGVVTNTGPLPSVVTDPDGNSASVLWPTQSITTDGGVLMPGWAPEPVLSLAAAVGGIAPVLATAASTGLVVAVGASMVAEVTAGQ